MRLITITPVVALSLQQVAAFWRMPCGNFDGTFRIDPIVNPGEPSDHAHTIHGSTGVSINAKFPDLMGSCTTCKVEQDKSAYW
jgi:hypothetical protein